MKKIFLCALFSAGALFLTSDTHAQSADTLKVVTIEVGNLHCDGDMPTIKKQLLNADGIDEVTFTDRKKQASAFTITYHTAATDPQRLKAVVENTAGCDEPDEKPYRVQRITNDKIAQP